jgi:hypothetical protein
MDETAAWCELTATVDAALWRYAEAVTGHPRTAADGDWRGLLSPDVALHLARPSLPI